MPEGLGVFLGEHVDKAIDIGHFHAADEGGGGDAALTEGEFVGDDADGLVLLEEVVEGIVSDAGAGDEDAVLDEEEGDVVALAGQIRRHVVHVAGVAVFEGIAGLDEKIIGQEKPPLDGQAPMRGAAVGYGDYSKKALLGSMDRDDWRGLDVVFV